MKKIVSVFVALVLCFSVALADTAGVLEAIFDISETGAEYKYSTHRATDAPSKNIIFIYSDEMMISCIDAYNKTYDDYTFNDYASFTIAANCVLAYYNCGNMSICLVDHEAFYDMSNIVEAFAAVRDFTCISALTMLNMY